MCVCKYKLKTNKNRRIVWKIFQGCFENKKGRKHEEIEFQNSIQIEFLLPFTGCRKVRGKMPANKRMIFSGAFFSKNVRGSSL